jgi:sarcosine oxidase subunit gamma
MSQTWPTHARSPLADWSVRFADASAADVRIVEVPFLAQLDLRADPGNRVLLDRLGAVLGVTPPTEPNTAIVEDAGGRRVLWLGPDEWLIIAPPGTASDMEAALRDALAADPTAAVVDVSANRTTLSLAGSAAREVLESGCSIDLHPRVFGPGSCAQTLVGRTGVILLQVSPEPDYRLLVRPSFAAYLAAWLLDAIDGVRGGPSPLTRGLVPSASPTLLALRTRG